MLLLGKVQINERKLLKINGTFPKRRKRIVNFQFVNEGNTVRYNKRSGLLKYRTDTKKQLVDGLVNFRA